MGFSVMLWDAEKLVPAEYWCPYGTDSLFYEWLFIIIINLASFSALCGCTERDN